MNRSAKDLPVVLARLLCDGATTDERSRHFGILWMEEYGVNV